MCAVMTHVGVAVAKAAHRAPEEPIVAAPATSKNESVSVKMPMMLPVCSLLSVLWESRVVIPAVILNVGNVVEKAAHCALEELMLAAPAISKKRSASVKILKMLHAWTLNPSVPLALGMVISVVILNAINVLVAQAQAASFSL